jgi:hypothetical protein
MIWSDTIKTLVQLKFNVINEWIHFIVLILPGRNPTLVKVVFYVVFHPNSINLSCCDLFFLWNTAQHDECMPGSLYKIDKQNDVI